MHSRRGGARGGWARGESESRRPTATWRSAVRAPRAGKHGKRWRAGSRSPSPHHLVAGTPFVARQTCVLEAMKCKLVQPRGTCSSDAQCRPRRHDPSALLRCVGAVPHLDLPGRCAVEVPPSPWNNTCEYARGASRGHPVLPTGAPCLQLAALQQTSRSSHGGNTIAVVVAGMAEGLAPLHVHASMRTCLIDALSSHVQVFANLQARTSSNM